MISFVSDVEGDVSYWHRFTNVSAALRADEAGLYLVPGAELVFGGDSVDKGGYDLAFLEELLALKERHPTRVHLILGNRDINKMRLAAELAPANWISAREHPGVYWRPEHTPATYLASLPPALRVDTSASRLKYMLSDNMGSPRAFELRRSELLERREGGGESGAAVSDEEVLASYMRSLQAGGVMRRFLEHARLAVLLDGYLFVHGAVHECGFGVVPGRPRCVSVSEWVDSLNAFAAEEVGEWARALDEGRAEEWRAPAERRWREGFFERPGGRLMAYGMARQPSGANAPTVVYSSYLDEGQPTPPSQQTVRLLAASGVHTLGVGHQPHGDCPVTMKCSSAEGASLTVVMADTSFGGSVEWIDGTDEASAEATRAAPPAPAESESERAKESEWAKTRGPPPAPPAEPRGISACEVCFEYAVPSERQSARASAYADPRALLIRGTLASGAVVDADALADAAIGTLRDGWWVKARLAGGSAYLLSRGRGYEVQNCLTDAQQLVNKPLSSTDR